MTGMAGHLLLHGQRGDPFNPAQQFIQKVQVGAPDRLEFFIASELGQQNSGLELGDAVIAAEIKMLIPEAVLAASAVVV